MTKRKGHDGFTYWIRVLRGEVKLPREEISAGGAWETAHFALRKYANTYIEDLISEFRNVTDPGVRQYLLELIGEARSPKALPVLTEVIQGDEEPSWSWAIYGLRDLESREARKVLWEAKSYVKQTEELTQLFQETLASCSRHLAMRMQEDGTWSDWIEEKR
jgi:hypothetical protein